MLKNIMKAAVGVVVAPVAVVVDTVMFIDDATNLQKSKNTPFSRTGNVLKNIADNVQKTIQN